MARSTFLLTLLCLLIHCSPQTSLRDPQTRAQQPISRTDFSGYIVRQGTKTPVAQLSVFVEGTTLATVTAEDGSFRLTGVPTGRTKLLLPRPGFAVFVKTFELLRNPKELVIQLPGSSAGEEANSSPVPRVAQLEREIEELTQRYYSSRKNSLRKRASVIGNEEIELFSKYILGRPGSCRLVNPEALEFEKRDRRAGFSITFESLEPLLVENRELGYRIWIYLQRASLWKDRGKYNMKYSGETLFEELSAEDDKQRDRWRKRRLDAYRGSYKHFLAALATGRLEEEGFLIIDRTENNFASGSGIPGARWSNVTKIPHENPYSLITRTGPSQVRLGFPGAIEVIYLFGKVDPDYLDFNRISEDAQTSMLSLLEGPIVFSVEGNVFEDKKVAKTGYWSIEQISRRLPRNYIPN